MANCIIGVPTFGEVSIHWTMSLTAIAMPINFTNQFSVVLKKRIDVARNEISQKLLPKIGMGKLVGASEEDILEAVLKQIAHGQIVNGALEDKGAPRFLFFLDDDVIMPPDTIRKMIYRMENSPEDVGAISGVYYSKSEPGEPLIFEERGRGSYWDWRVGDFFPIWAAGCGCVLIRVETLKRMREQKGDPLFLIDYGLHKREDGVLEARSITEDLYFYDKMGKTLAPNGKPYSLWIDTSIQANHYDKHSGKFFGLSPEEPQAQGRKPIKIKDKLDMAWVGCGNSKQYFDGVNVTRIDSEKSLNPDVVAFGDQLPFENEIFDIVYSAYLLHTFENPKKVLGEWCRILKKDGKIHVKVPDIEFGLAQAEKSPAAALEIIYQGKTGFTKEIAKQVFTEAGFVDLYIFSGNNGLELNILGRKKDGREKR